ncbi:MAG TPA: hypothetical protein VMT30_09335 [Candidatus Saccharimonadia bacterium]|nr:hypothetical protein [Candidatus Saccharimonadia bacterium]
MTRCPRCQSNAIHSENNFASCLMCGETIRDEPDMLTKLLSNTAPETGDVHTHFVNRLAPIEAPAAVTARVLAAVRAEAAR